MTKQFVGERIDALNTTVTAALNNLAQGGVTANVNGDANDGFNDDDDNQDIAFADGKEDVSQGPRFRTYGHGGRLWDTPPKFEFPSEIHPSGNDWPQWIIFLPGHTINSSYRTTQA